MTKKRKKRIADKAPIEILQEGRFTRMKSNMSANDLSKIHDRMRKERPGLAKAISEQIANLRSYISNHNPHSVLGPLAFHHLLSDPETYSEPTHEGRESHVEFALNLVGSIRYDNAIDDLEDADSDYIQKEIQEIFNQVALYYISEEPSSSLQEQELRVLSLLRTLNVRGSSYWEHEVDLVRGLFAKEDDFFDKHFGFTATDAISYFLQVDADLESHIAEAMKVGIRAKEAHDRFGEFVDNNDVSNLTQEEIFEQALTPEDLAAIEAFIDATKFPPFQLHPRDELPSAFLDRVSFEPGNNEVFFSYKKAPGWPLSNSDIVLKPVLKLDSEYHAYVPQLLLRGMSSILQEWMREADNAYFRHKWKPRSADYLEAEARKYLMQALPSAQYYSSAYFEFDPGDGDGFRRFETDGLLLYDDILLVVEAKAGALSKSTRRGSAQRLRRDAKELVGYAAEQGFRVLDYMSANQEAEFLQEDGSPLVTLNRSEIRETFVVNVTLEHLGHIATKMPTLRELNVVGGGDWVWSVFLNDLRIVAELVETPSEFILYLRRRLGSNEYVFEATDEIDFLGFFLSEGLFFEADNPEGLDKFVPHGYSTPIDRWYDFIAERVDSADKPRLQIDDRVKALVKELDFSVHGGRTEAGTLLLSLETQLSKKFVDELLPNLQSLAKQDGKSHDVTLVLNDGVNGLTVTVVPSGGSAPDEDYALRQMLAKNRSRWIQINYNLDLNLHSAHPPRLYSAPAEFPKRIVDSVERISIKRVREVVGDNPRSYPRNEKCPCRSGKKYKKCCLRRLQP